MQASRQDSGCSKGGNILLKVRERSFKGHEVPLKPALAGTVV
jgi:hypothetical protein